MANTHESMTDTTHGLPDDVLEQTAEAVYTNAMGPMWEDEFDDGSGGVPYQEWRGSGRFYDIDGGITPELIDLTVRAALPILVPAIETAMLERMIADFVRRFQWAQLDDETFYEPLYKWLAKYLEKDG